MSSLSQGKGQTRTSGRTKTICGIKLKIHKLHYRILLAKFFYFRSLEVAPHMFERNRYHNNAACLFFTSHHACTGCTMAQFTQLRVWMWGFKISPYISLGHFPQQEFLWTFQHNQKPLIYITYVITYVQKIPINLLIGSWGRIQGALMRPSRLYMWLFLRSAFHAVSQFNYYKQPNS
jgi:hypothetical protein